jgi:hypothetical protein
MDAGLHPAAMMNQITADLRIPIPSNRGRL